MPTHLVPDHNLVRRFGSARRSLTLRHAVRRVGALAADEQHCVVGPAAT